MGYAGALATEEADQWIDGLSGHQPPKLAFSIRIHDGLPFSSRLRMGIEKENEDRQRHH
jgi:hypothetical protein